MGDLLLQSQTQMELCRDQAKSTAGVVRTILSIPALMENSDSGEDEVARIYHEGFRLSIAVICIGISIGRPLEIGGLTMV
jgi:hypothetical protein